MIVNLGDFRMIQTAFILSTIEQMKIKENEKLELLKIFIQEEE